MNKYKIRMVIAILVAVMLLIYMIVPMFSMADKEALNMDLTKVEINGGYQINVTGSSPSKILALTYINEKKTVADFNSNAEAMIAYFEGEKSTKLNITSDNYIDEVINVVNYGDYTVYLRNENGEIQLAYITINDKAAISLEATSQENSDSKNILIKAKSTSNITTIKVLKTNDQTTPANFTNATNLLNSEKEEVELTYPIIENGIYQVYAQDANKNKKIQTVNIFNGDSPISINTSVEGKTISINVQDCVADVQTIKIAPKDRINSISDFETTGTNINFEGNNNIKTNYEVSAEGIYVIFVKDNAGSTYMKSVDVTTTPDQSIQFYKLNNNESTIYVVAADSNNKINLAKYMISDGEKSLEDVRDNGTEIAVSEGQCVTLKIESNVSNDKFISVYVKDTYGYEKMAGISINGIKSVNEIPGVSTEQQIPSIPEQQEIKDEPTKQEENKQNQPEIHVGPSTPIEVTAPINSDELTKKEEPEPQQQPNTEGAIDLNNIKMGDDSDFEQIPDKTVAKPERTDKTTVKTEKTDSGVKVVEDKTASDIKYPQTGTNNTIVILGIIVSTVIAIVSYVKMKNEK